MRARLFARYGPEAGLELEFGGEATIGRGSENSVPLSSREVSQRHARVFFDADSAAYWVEDLGSLNGTLLDGEPVTGRERLGSLHVLSFGAAAELFFLELDREPEQPEAVSVKEAGIEEADADAQTVPPDAPDEDAGKRTRVDVEPTLLPPKLRAKKDQPSAAETGSSTRVEEAPVGLPPSLVGPGEAPEAPAGGPRFVLEILGGSGGSFELRDGENLVGRSGRARVVLSHRELSRRHATLRVNEGRVWVRDEGSRNHTFVGDRQVSGEVEIEPGAELRFGRLEVRLRLEAAQAEEEAE